MNYLPDVHRGTFVSVGNGREPFTRLLNEVDRLARLGLLPAPVLVQHGYTPFSSPVCEGVHQLRTSEFDDAILGAKLVILQAGAGSVLTALRQGRRPIVMARRPEFQEILDDHQVEFLQHLGARRLVVPVCEPNELRQRVTEALEQTESRGTVALVQNIRLQEAVASILRAPLAIGRRH